MVMWPPSWALCLSSKLRVFKVVSLSVVFLLLNPLAHKVSAKSRYSSMRFGRDANR